MRRALVVLSGGQDSTTCLFQAKQTYDSVSAVTFNYGQRHIREIQSAKIIAQLADVEHDVIHVPGILNGTSPLVNADSTLEQYKDWQNLPGGLEKTFVPMRNQLFLTIAANRAVCMGAKVLVTGVSGEDFGGYPDCRQEFISALESAIILGTYIEPTEDPPFTIATPLMFLTKSQTVSAAMAVAGCYGALAFSHTAYDGAYPPVGRDHATLLRAKGFELAGVPDPLIVRAYWEGVMAPPDTPTYIQWRGRMANFNPFGRDDGLGDAGDSHGYAKIVSAALEKMIRG